MTRRIRVFDSPFMHRLGQSDVDPRISYTVCGIRFCWMGWPRGFARPPLPDCRGCS
jgi:hypothetical protein